MWWFWFRVYQITCLYQFSPSPAPRAALILGTFSFISSICTNFHSPQPSGPAPFLVRFLSFHQSVPIFTLHGPPAQPHSWYVFSLFINPYQFSPSTALRADLILGTSSLFSLIRTNFHPLRPSGPASFLVRFLSFHQSVPISTLSRPPGRPHSWYVFSLFIDPYQFSPSTALRAGLIPGTSSLL